jgi:hypothetical protein
MEHVIMSDLDHDLQADVIQLTRALVVAANAELGISVLEEKRDLVVIMHALINMCAMACMETANPDETVEVFATGIRGAIAAQNRSAPTPN